jgi:hypothetical protein
MQAVKLHNLAKASHNDKSAVKTLICDQCNSSHLFSGQPHLTHKKMMGAVTSTCELYTAKMHPSNNLSGNSGSPPELFQLTEHYLNRCSEVKDEKTANKAKKQQAEEEEDK